jgi:6-phosphogluconate dehydrogenase
MEQVAAAAGEGILIGADPFAARLRDTEAGWRETLGVALRHGVPVPALSASLAYWDGLRAARLATSLLQAQRDRFGAHGFGRTDGPGVFHGPWAERP